MIMESLELFFDVPNFGRNAPFVAGKVLREILAMLIVLFIQISTVGPREIHHHTSLRLPSQKRIQDGGQQQTLLHESREDDAICANSQPRQHEPYSEVSTQRSARAVGLVSSTPYRRRLSPPTALHRSSYEVVVQRRSRQDLSRC